MQLYVATQSTELFCFRTQWADLSEMDSITVTDLCKKNCAAYNPANGYYQNFGSLKVMNNLSSSNVIRQFVQSYLLFNN